MVTLLPHALDFNAAFRAFDADHRPPLKWQTRLYEQLVCGGRGDIPGVCRLPTGLGKTSIIPICLIALACGAHLPRRLVYIVNRRTVVDQATDDAKRLLARLYRSGQRDKLEWATEEAIKKLGLESEPHLPNDDTDAAKSLRMTLRQMRTALDALCTGDPAKCGDAVPLAVSTLRGELADNGDWKKNPARPAIIIGTVDMIGSRLLFSGFGDGRYGRVHHAGLLGQDALVVHDEAHLEPAFDELLTGICEEQRRAGEAKPIRVMRLSATARPDRSIGASQGGAGETSPACARDTPADVFELTPEDERDEIVSQRLHAKKQLAIREIGDTDGAGAVERLDAADAEGEQPEQDERKARRKKSKADLASTIAAAAFEHEGKKCRVMVYVRTPDLAIRVSDGMAERLGLATIMETNGDTGEQRAERRQNNVERIEALKHRVRVLTGTIRGHERDALAESELLLAFKSGRDRSKALSHTMYLVSTSAGEVGADWDADHLVCDLATLDSMAQRFGRVNRLGGKDHSGQERSAQIVVVTEQAVKNNAGDGASGAGSEGEDSQGKQGKAARQVNQYEAAVLKTGEMLCDIARNGGDVSPAALGEFLQKLSDGDKKAAFSPAPTILPATDILFDHWSLTSIGWVNGPDGRWRDALPGRPTVEPYLHGVADWDPPETHVAWRADIALLSMAGKDQDGEEVPYSKDDTTNLKKVFEVFPLRSAEQLRDRTDRVVEELAKIAARLRDEHHTETRRVRDDTEVARKSIDTDPLVVVMKGAAFTWERLSRLVPGEKMKKEDAARRLAFATVVLPVKVGGLTKDGMLDGATKPPEDPSTLDVAEWDSAGLPSRQRVLIGPRPSPGDDEDTTQGEDQEAEPSERALVGGKVVHGLVRRHWVQLHKRVENEDAEPATLEHRVAKGQDREPGVRIGLSAHNDAVASAAERVAGALGLDRSTVRAIVLAGRLHDLGKGRDRWQQYANNPRPSHPDEPYDLIAKNKRYRHWKQLAGYRHELGSLHDASAKDDIRSLDPDTRDLVLHLIAAHHGWARPHFEPRHFDPGNPSGGGGTPRPTADNERVAVETMQRFARLQQRYGRWGLAWLESILRCADAATSESSAPADNGAGTSGSREGGQGGAA
ncbi:MAG: type I-U CRISPR-associated helicase/endonuclease Cas3 [Phycisphaerales bacterium]|nr:type I-U CRISPR-associated helicase/endonuclease Cas3 [Phycisphaerales bacterium]